MCVSRALCTGSHEIINRRLKRKFCFFLNLNGLKRQVGTWQWVFCPQKWNRCSYLCSFRPDSTCPTQDMVYFVEIQIKANLCLSSGLPLLNMSWITRWELLRNWLYALKTPHCDRTELVSFLRHRDKTCNIFQSSALTHNPLGFKVLQHRGWYWKEIGFMFTRNFNLDGHRNMLYLEATHARHQARTTPPLYTSSRQFVEPT